MFRLARWLPLGLGLLASIALVIAVVVAAHAFLPIVAPTGPAPLETPKPVALSAKDIQQPIAAPASKQAPAADDSAAATGPDVRAAAPAAEARGREAPALNG